MLGCGDSVSRVKTDQKVVALTFDDGPNPPYTEKSLDVLDDKGIKATFFLVGGQVDRHVESARMIIARGHEVGGHGYDWDSLLFLGWRRLRSELDRMDVAFTAIGVTNLVYFRPPGGLLFPWQNRMLKKRGLRRFP